MRTTLYLLWQITNLIEHWIICYQYIKIKFKTNENCCQLTLGTKQTKQSYEAHFNSPFSNNNYRLLDSLVVKYWYRVQEVPGSIPSQGPRHTKDVIKMIPGSSLVVVVVFGFVFCLCFWVFFLAFDFCRFCVVIRFFHPHHNSQWPLTSKDFYTRSYPLHYFLILILEKSQYFPFQCWVLNKGTTGNLWSSVLTVC